MEIYNSCKSAPHTTFKGIPVARSTTCIKNMETNIDLFQITNKDKNFLEKLKNIIKMDELYPSKRIQKHEYERWHEMLEVAVNKAFEKGRKCFVAFKENKPCGIITFEQGEKKFHLDCICTWPVETGKKVTLAGQTLFKQMFGNFLESKAGLLDLTAILNGPFDTVSKYSKLGFKQVGGENHLVAMRTNRSNTENTMKKLNDIILTTPIKDADEVDLIKTFDM